MDYIEPTGALRGLLDGSLDRDEAVLMVFSPRNYGRQIVRPYKIKITDDLIDAVGEHRTVADALRPGSSRDLDRQLITAIAPDPIGFEVHTGDIDDCYTFMLVEDNVSEGGRGGNKSRRLTVGYADDEPVSFKSGRVNEEAVLIPTHSTRMAMEYESTQRERRERPTTFQDLDIVTHMVEALTDEDDETLFLGTVGDLAKGVQFDDDPTDADYQGSITYFNDSSISSLQDAEQRRTVNRSPYHIMQTVGDAIDSSLRRLDPARPVSPMSNSRYGADPIDQYSDLVKAQLEGTITAARAGRRGFDVTGPFIMDNLCEYYPDIIVRPMQFNDTESHRDVRGQEDTSLNNQMSSMAASVITAVAMSTSIADINFRYNSLGGGSSLMTRGGSYDISDAAPPRTTVPMSDATYDQCVDAFFENLEECLWPILEQNGGPFDIMVEYSTVGDTAITLNFLDYTREHGCYETGNRYGGLTSPILTPGSIMETNSDHLRAFTDGVGNRIGAGPVSRHSSIIDDLAGMPIAEKVTKRLRDRETTRKPRPRRGGKRGARDAVRDAFSNFD